MAFWPHFIYLLLKVYKYRIYKLNLFKKFDIINLWKG